MSELKKLQVMKAQATSRGHNKRVRDLCSEIGQRLIDMGRYQEAILEFEELKTDSEDAHDRLEVAFAFRKLGEISVYLNEYEQALRYQNDYLSIAQGQGSDIEIQRALTTLGGTYLAQAQFKVENNLNYNSPEIVTLLELAEKYCQEAYDAIKCIFDPSCSDREKDEMKCVIYINRVKIHDFLNRPEKSDEAFSKAERKLRENKLFDRLQILYELKAGVEHKRGNLDEALSLAEKSLKLMNHSKNSAQFIEGLSFMAQILVDMRSFDKAKRTLLQAYRSTYRGDKEPVIEMLKRIVRIIKTLENETLNDVQRFERVGDFCTDMSAFNAALWYYESALVKCDGDLNRMTALYSSIAATYKDLKKFDKATQYYLKEAELNKDRPEDAYTTMMAIAVTTDLDRQPYPVVRDLYYESRKFAVRSGNVKREIRCLIELSKLQRDRGIEEEALATEREYKSLLHDHNISCEEDVYSEDDDNEDDNYDDSDFNVDELTDDEESNRNRNRKRGRVSLKKDMKGETELHRKVKKDGNMNIVKRLIEQAVTVDIEDNAKFTPLHEACNHGQLEYVKLLVEMGDACVHKVSDDGTTPLISAAVNGYIEIVEYLLDKGAKAHSQDNEGWTALDYLEDLMSKNEDESQEILQGFRRTCDRLRRAIELKIATGFRLEPKKRSSSAHFLVVGSKDNCVDEENVNDDLSSGVQHRDGKRATKRHHNRNDLDLDEYDKKTRATEEYAAAISAIRTSSKNSTPSVLIPKTSTIYSKDVITEQQYESMIDDDDAWLENDLPTHHKKRKNKLIDGITFNRNSKRSCNRKPSSQETQEKCFSPPLLEPVLVPEDDPCESSSLQKVKENTSVTRVKVQVQDKLFLITIKSHDSTAGWLAEEAANRYYSSTGLLPSLTLSTLDGAEIHTEDVLTSVLANDDDKIQSHVQSWNVPPIHERYTRACEELGRTRFRNIERDLSRTQCSGTFHCSLFLKPCQAQPLFRSLKCQTSLVELALPRNRLGSEGLKFLCEALPTLKSLRRLDLSLNQLDLTSLDHLRVCLDNNDGTVILRYLEDLNLGHNELGNSSSTQIVQIVQRLPSLSTLNLASCGFTSQFFEYHKHDLAEIFKRKSSSSSPNYVSPLRNLNFANNNFGEEGLETLFECVNPLEAKFINISGCSKGSVSLSRVLDKFTKRGNPDVGLKKLNISNLCLTEIDSNSEFLNNLGHLSHLDLSGNADLSLESLTRLLEGAYSKNVPLKELNLTAIESSFDSKNDFSRFTDIFKQVMTSTKLALFSFSVTNCASEHNLVTELSKIWKDHYGNKSKITLKNGTNWIFRSAL